MIRIAVYQQMDGWKTPKRTGTYEVDTIEQLEAYDWSDFTNIEGYVASYVFDAQGRRLGWISRHKGFIKE